MKNSKTILSLTAAVLMGTSALYTLSMPAMAQDNHTESEGDHEEEGVVEMDFAQRQKNGVITARISMQTLSDEIIAPGEVVLNQYKTAHVTPRISGQITKRHAKLGQLVKRGAPLVTLTSVKLAEAQGSAIVAAQEWQRVQNLGQDIVSKRRYFEAQIASQLSEAKIKAYGMTPMAVAKLLAGGDASKATGTFTLYASQSGTVMKDAFVMGEIIEPGRELFVISDESKAWVNVKLSHESADNIQIGMPVRIKTGSGDNDFDWSEGKVLQLDHIINETTRTLAVRVELDNAGDRLHAGQFVTAYLQTDNATKVSVIQSSAITIMSNQNIVFELIGDEFQPLPIQIGRSRGTWTEIQSGLSAESEVAISQVFLLKSLILKSQIGDHD